MLPEDTIYLYEHYIKYEGGKDDRNHLEQSKVHRVVTSQDKDEIVTRGLKIQVSDIGQIQVFHGTDELEEISAVLYSYSPSLKPSTLLKMKEALFNKLDREMAKRNKVIQRLKDEHL